MLSWNPHPHLVTPAALKIPQTPDTTKLHPSRKLQKTVLHPLDILRPKTKTSGNCTSYVVHHFFLITPGNSMLFLINPWEIPLAISSVPLEISHLRSPLLFSGISPLWSFLKNVGYLFAVASKLSLDLQEKYQLKMISWLREQELFHSKYGDIAV